jgi:hypothetical protein
MCAQHAELSNLESLNAYAQRVMLSNTQSLDVYATHVNASNLTTFTMCAEHAVLSNLDTSDMYAKHAMLSNTQSLEVYAANVNVSNVTSFAMCAQYAELSNLESLNAYAQRVMLSNAQSLDVYATHVNLSNLSTLNVCTEHAVLSNLQTFDMFAQHAVLSNLQTFDMFAEYAMLSNLKTFELYATHVAMSNVATLDVSVERVAMSNSGLLTVSGYSRFDGALTAVTPSVSQYTVHVEEVGGGGATVPVTSIYFYTAYPEFQARLAVGTTFRIADHLGAVAQYSPYVTITSYIAARSGNPAQAQLNFTPAIVMKAYSTTVFVIASTPAVVAPSESRHCGVFVEATVKGQSVVGMGKGVFVEGRDDVGVTINTSTSAAAASAVPPERRVLVHTDGRVALGDVDRLAPPRDRLSLAQLEVVPLPNASNQVIAFASPANPSRRHVVRSDHSVVDGDPYDALSFMIGDGIESRSNLSVRMSGVGVHVPVGQTLGGTHLHLLSPPTLRSAHVCVDSNGGASLETGRAVVGHGTGVLAGYTGNAVDAGVALRVGPAHGGARLEGLGDSDMALWLRADATSHVRIGCEVGSARRTYIEATGRHGLELTTPGRPTSNALLTTPSLTPFVVRAGGSGSVDPSACNGLTVHHSRNHVGIGLSNGAVPAATLHVEGDAYVSGDVRVLSDARAKTDLEVIGGALGRVGALTGYTYLFNGGASRSTGLVAQDVRDVLPEAVHTDPHSGTLFLAYGNLAGLFVEAIKELGAEVARLRRCLEGGV